MSTKNNCLVFFIVLVAIVCCLPRSSRTDWDSWFGLCTASVPSPVSGKPFRSKTGIEFVWIPPGSFEMGSNDYINSRPCHIVKLEKGFWMAKHEVSQNLWQKVMRNNPQKDTGYCGDYPVFRVSWHESIEFCKRLSKIEKLELRLPSEAEWEYVSKMGEVVLPRLEYTKNDRHHFLKLVSQGKPNKLGIYHMLGNASEWCFDVWHPNYQGAPSDGKPRLSGNAALRVVRGGGFLNHYERHNPVNRQGVNAYEGVAGLRLVLNQ